MAKSSSKSSSKTRHSIASHPVTTDGEGKSRTFKRGGNSSIYFTLKQPGAESEAVIQPPELADKTKDGWESRCTRNLRTDDGCEIETIFTFEPTESTKKALEGRSKIKIDWSELQQTFDKSFLDALETGEGSKEIDCRMYREEGASTRDTHKYSRPLTHLTTSGISVCDLEGKKLGRVKATAKSYLVKTEPRSMLSRAAYDIGHFFSKLGNRLKS